MRYRKGSNVVLNRDLVRTEDMQLFGINVPIGDIILPKGSSGRVTDIIFGTGIGLYTVQFTPQGLCFTIPDDWLSLKLIEVMRRLSNQTISHSIPYTNNTSYER